MILVTGTIRLPAARLDAALPVMREMIAQSRAEDGCIDYSYARDLLDPDLIRVAEMWRSREALDAHFGAPHLARWRQSWAGLGITDRNLVLHEVHASSPT
ncbi:quinol monooxygenase YgiN [Sphingomonas naasensis]|uniref:Antibiotic biosynthesis monooxygenase n=1 Tax=Sphingomonas naasensis TaxID=1344951 RepID=A0A4V3QW07_9SPHN|nr:putative quinol monooxygenase [Sphingomonas naasensis]NIJ22266.1 quinol monooxygenase YgiN [Sphingomonas naasensis]TGX40722.1 antibiotic biosynthesis monooxygenase [Sphingomonas naasensis]